MLNYLTFSFGLTISYILSHQSILYIVLTLTSTKLILDHLPQPTYHGKGENIQVRVKFLLLMPKPKYELLCTCYTLKML